MKRTIRPWTLVLATVLAFPVFGGVTANAAAAQVYAPRVQTTSKAPAVTGSTEALAASCCHVTIPSNYVYNPSTTYQRTLHDYCSYSPDEFPAPGVNANFRGPCARHDMCYQYHQKSQLGCDNQLGSHLVQECTYTYAWYDPRRAACVNTAWVYWAAVVIHTLWP